METEKISEEDSATAKRSGQAVDTTELRLMSFFEEEKVRPVMLSQYLKELGVYKENEALCAGRSNNSIIEPNSAGLSLKKYIPLTSQGSHT